MDAKARIGGSWKDLIDGGHSGGFETTTWLMGNLLREVYYQYIACSQAWLA